MSAFTTSRPKLTDEQLAVIEAPVPSRIFLEGPAGSGKTTAAVERLLNLMVMDVPGERILLLTPQRTLAGPYLQALQEPGVLAGGLPSVLTVGGLAQRMLTLFWPLVSESAGFYKPDDPPVFLTLETAQYYMAHLVRPLLDKGFFDSVTIDPNRLYSQILDNLNKAACVGFPHTEIGERLKSAWGGVPGQLHIYDDTQDCASRFRQYCMEHNLLDFSLQLEVFWRHLWPHPTCQGYLQRSFRHLVYENIEEDFPLAHDIVRAWLPGMDTALLVYDQDAGYRRFLGADPSTAYGLKVLCSTHQRFSINLVQNLPVQALGIKFVQVLAPAGSDIPSLPVLELLPHQAQEALAFENKRFYPQMLDWTAERIAHLVSSQGVLPGEIAVLAPFVSDSLRFALTHRLETLGIPVRSHRPSRSLRAEPVVQCLLTAACLAYPEWGMHPARFDFACMLLQALKGMDFVRAQLLAEIVYRQHDAGVVLSPFESIRPPVQERITYVLGERYELLRLWLEAFRQSPEAELDVFLSRLFGEVLSQPGFGFHSSYTAAEISANLIESVQKFRWAAGETLAGEGINLGSEYFAMLQEGVIAAQYIRSWQDPVIDAVYLAPAYTFLIANRPVDYQFWLDVGSRGWFERLYQPLTHPYVLSRHWQRGRVWDTDDEYETGQQALYHLAQGLLRRCRKGIYLGLSELGEQGYEQRGPLLRALQRVLRVTGHEASVV